MVAGQPNHALIYFDQQKLPVARRIEYHIPYQKSNADTQNLDPSFPPAWRMPKPIQNHTSLSVYAFENIVKYLKHTGFFQEMKCTS